MQRNWLFLIFLDLSFHLQVMIFFQFRIRNGGELFAFLLNLVFYEINFTLKSNFFSVARNETNMVTKYFEHYLDLLKIIYPF